MLQPRISSSLRRALLNPTSQSRLSHQQSPHIHRSLLLLRNRPHAQPFTSAPALRTSNTPPPASQQEKPNDPKKETFIPRPLGRPIGFATPPLPGQNTGTSTPQPKEYKSMTRSERNMAKRMDLVEKFGTNYFRDFKNIRKYRSGKTFMANARIFKREAALYFPNLRGATLEGGVADTTSVLAGKASVVKVYSSHWGEIQVGTFTSREANPGLHALLEEHGDKAQMVDVNIEENAMKAVLLRVFRYSLRRQRKKEDWGKYFVVRKGVTERIRETIGLLNGRVGYVYLLDRDCKIRWAGSADAEGTEVDDLTRGFAKLIKEDAQEGKEVKVDSLAGSENGEEKTAEADKPLPVPVPVAF
ncbi:unnamed protein product [Periconia digitata]|uniref:Mitochondrial ATPase complex subunit ATP10 n=1 Tax=Periconia digitata TaxID=1303443 RepID=A0A9W4XDA1_9PLEO|nr:unnamed protein product [Periconia digitata]